ncbi:MAG: metallophosphoesterase, partial [Clostridia bacterium]|nr:metallophosphoesterase [Clostridia bacterium]
DVCITGTKGYPETEGIPTAENEKKLYLREIQRLQNAVLDAKKTGAKKTIVMLHYPPGTDTEFAKILKEASVDYCIYGHLHGGTYGAVTKGNVGGVEYRLTSCDYLKFAPIEITEF